MDRRRRKTREAIFSAFIALLSKKDFEQITVGEIIEKADIGRATFYAHFETKEFSLPHNNFISIEVGVLIQRQNNKRIIRGINS